MAITQESVSATMPAFLRVSKYCIFLKSEFVLRSSISRRGASRLPSALMIFCLDFFPGDLPSPSCWRVTRQVSKRHPTSREREAGRGKSTRHSLLYRLAIFWPPGSPRYFSANARALAFHGHPPRGGKQPGQAVLIVHRNPGRACRICRTIYPDYPAPIVCNGSGGRELAMARWGTPSSPRALMDATKKRAQKLDAQGKQV